MRQSLVSVLIGLVLILSGSLTAHMIQTSDGIQVDDIRIPLEDGRQLSAYLYTPENATEATPAPGILAVHGYINSRETQSSFAIEFARRGYVVLAMDQSGHGYSTNTAFSSAFGGPAGLNYLRSLPFVDTDRIGLEGHSMGGWTILNAAMAMPDAYQSMALVGSSTGAPFAQPGTESFPKNLAVIFSKFDEFSPLMWGVERAAGVNDSAKLQTVFGTNDTIIAGELYGSVEDGTARMLTQPVTTHPGDHLDFGATADALSWMELTLGAPNPLPGSNQIWHFKEMGTLVGFIGAIVFLIGIFSLISQRLVSSETQDAAMAISKPSGPIYLTALTLGILLPALTYFPLTHLGEQMPNLGIFRQNITNQIMVWALGNGAIAGLGLLIARQFGITLAPKGLIAALGAAGALLVVSVLVSLVFKVDFRFWVVALKPLGLHHWPIFLSYLLPFLIFFYLSHAALVRLFAVKEGLVSQLVLAWLASAGGMTFLIGWVYAALFAKGKLPDFADPLFSIVGIQFVPILTITAIIAVVSWRTCRAALPGALLSALFVTWYIVAGQATHI